MSWHHTQHTLSLRPSPPNLPFSYSSPILLHPPPPQCVASPRRPLIHPPRAHKMHRPTTTNPSTRPLTTIHPTISPTNSPTRRIDVNISPKTCFRPCTEPPYRGSGSVRRGVHTLHGRTAQGTRATVPPFPSLLQRLHCHILLIIIIVLVD